MKDVKTDYYSLLEAWPKSPAEEIKKNYFRLAKIYHPDVAGNTTEVKERFKLINEAYCILSDPQKRREYDETLRKNGSSKSAGELRAQDGKSAALAFQQAREAMKAQSYGKAALLLETAIRADAPNPAYHSWYGFCVAMSGGNLHEARDACRKAIEVEFYNPDYHANLGFVYFKAGLKSLAVKHFSEALKWDPHHAVAAKFMARVNDGKPRQEGPIDKMLRGVKKALSRS